MPIVAGDLDRRVLLQYDAGGRDSYGQVVEDWRDVGQVWAKVRWLSGGETFNEGGAQRVARQMVEFTIRFRPNLHPRLRVVWETRVYDIVDVAEIGRREGLTLRAYADEVQPGV